MATSALRSSPRSRIARRGRAGRPGEAESAPSAAVEAARSSSSSRRAPSSASIGPFKGCSGELLARPRAAPFEAGIRAGGAYDTSLGLGRTCASTLELGLGSGLRAIVGGLLLFGALSLPDRREATERASPVDGGGLARPLRPRPRRSPTSWQALRARVGIDAELVYTAYRLASRRQATAPFRGRGLRRRRRGQAGAAPALGRR